MNWWMVAYNRQRRILFFYTPEITGATKVSQYIQQCVSEELITLSYTCKSSQKEQEIRQILEQIKPDIVFCSFIQLSPSVIKVAHEIGNIKIIIRNDYLLKDVNKDIVNQVRKTYPLADLLIVQTQQMMLELQNYVGILTPKIYILSNPLDKNKINLLAEEGGNPYPNDGCFHYLWVGREKPIKDLDTLISAFNIVKKQIPDSTLSLVSNTTNPYRWMKYADCFVLSSKSEASPNVLKEALFLHVPVVSTLCSPVVNNLIINGRNGFKVDVGNKFMMAQAMIDIRKLCFQSGDLFLPTIEEIKLLIK